MGIWIVCLMIFFVGSSLWCYYKGRMQEETDQKQTAATLAGPGRIDLEIFGFFFAACPHVSGNACKKGKIV